MKRSFATLVLLAIFLIGIAAMPGCNGDVNWDDVKDIAWMAVQEFIAQQILIAKTKFDDNEDGITHWVKANLAESKLYQSAKAKLDEFNIVINEDAIIEAIYKIINANWHKVLMPLGYDTDAGDGIPAAVLWDVAPADFPEIYDVKIE